MKRTISLIMVLCLAVSLAGCSRSMNYIIDHMPSFEGVVTEFCEDEYIVVDTDAADKINEKYDFISVSLDVENADSMTHFDIGDKVAVYYEKVYENENGAISPDIVYAIVLLEPADREKNKMS